MLFDFTQAPYHVVTRRTNIQLPDSSLQAYTWDARGNLTYDGTFTYTYNAAGRLVHAATLTRTLVYTYSADGLRVAQNVDGVETTFAWDAVLPIAQVLVSTEAGAAYPTRYVHGVDLVAEYQANAWQYPLGDSLGSVRQVVDAAGAVTYAVGYTPFGEELWQTGTATTDWGYTGEWQDPDVGLIYLRARWFSPSIGRFTRQDPWRGNVQQPGTGNSYAYGLNNPLTCTDPTGKWCLGGFDFGWISSCTPEEREQWAQVWTEMGQYFSGSGAFVEGFTVELLDTMLLSGIQLPLWILEQEIAKHPNVQLLHVALLLLNTECGNPYALELYRQQREPYTSYFQRPDENFQRGRMIGRGTAFAYGVIAVAGALLGGPPAILALVPTGIGPAGAAAVATAIGAHGVVVINVVVVKERVDPLLWKIATTGSPGGGGGNGGGGSGQVEPLPGQGLEESFETQGELLDDAKINPQTCVGRGCQTQALENAISPQNQGRPRAVLKIYNEDNEFAHAVLGLMDESGQITVIDTSDFIGRRFELSNVPLNEYLEGINQHQLLWKEDLMWDGLSAVDRYVPSGYSRIVVVDVTPRIIKP